MYSFYVETTSRRTRRNRIKSRKTVWRSAIYETTAERDAAADAYTVALAEHGSYSRYGIDKGIFYSIDCVGREDGRARIIIDNAHESDVLPCQRKQLEP